MEEEDLTSKRMYEALNSGTDERRENRLTVWTVITDPDDSRFDLEAFLIAKSEEK